MREIHLNGYIDDAEWFGDEITPESLHEMLYPPGEGAQDDLRIILNSYGGSCNAAVRMFDDLRAYPGNVHIIVSGTAASAAIIFSCVFLRLSCRLFSSSVCAVTAPASAGSICWANAGTVWPPANHRANAPAAIFSLIAFIYVPCYVTF